MAGRTRKFNPVLSEQDKATLEKIVSSRTEEIRKVQRAEFSHARERCSHRCERLKNLVVH
ncbi:MAG: hypothetical protein ACLSE8_02060 [Parasutterella sp.]